MGVPPLALREAVRGLEAGLDVKTGAIDDS